MFVQCMCGPLLYLTSPRIETPHAFSTRLGGVSRPPYDTLNLGPSGEDSRENILENYARLCHAAGLERNHLVFTKQVHGDVVRVVTAAESGEGLLKSAPPACDALVTGDSGVVLTVFSADCVPILLFDEAAHVAAAVHSGWRGTAKGIVRRALHVMMTQFGARPETVRAAIGPSIGPCCFETHADVPNAMTCAWGALAAPCIVNRPDGMFSVNLQELNARLLCDAGVPARQISVSEDCTCCRADRFFSHRRDGLRRGLQVALISL